MCQANFKRNGGGEMTNENNTTFWDQLFVFQPVSAPGRRRLTFDGVNTSVDP